MGIFKDKITQLDNMFLDKIKQAATQLSYKERQSNHDAQILILDKTPTSSKKILQKHNIRQINDETIAKFQ